MGQKITVIRRITPERSEIHEEETTWTGEIVNTFLLYRSMAGIIGLLFLLKGVFG